MIVDPRRLPDMPPFQIAVPDICKPRSHGPKNLSPSSDFSYDLKCISLASVRQESMWTTQIESMARACGCYREMTTRFGVYPKPTTIEAFIFQTRFSTCWRILTANISGPVWAYMRILGYNKIPVFKDQEDVIYQPAPVDAFYYAKQAAARLLIPGTDNQSRVEVVQMVEEMRTATAEDYPSSHHFKIGIGWVRTILENMIKNGDRQVCESLFDGNPSFAPAWRDDVPYEAPWVLPGKPLSATPKALPPCRIRARKEKAAASAAARAKKNAAVKALAEAYANAATMATLVPGHAQLQPHPGNMAPLSVPNGRSQQHAHIEDDEESEDDDEEE